jgi:hypothetical protein
VRDLGTNHAQRDRIIEHERPIANLMRRPPLRNPIGRPAPLPFLHTAIVEADIASQDGKYGRIRKRLGKS